MTQGATVHVEGLNTLVRTLNKAGVDITELKDANQAAANLVAQAAAMRAPTRSGRLAASVRGSRLARGARVSAGRSSVPYAGPIHWGWPARGIAANPFISEAAQLTEPLWTAKYRDDVEQALAKVKGA